MTWAYHYKSLLQIFVDRDECAARIDGESMKMKLGLHNVLRNARPGMFHHSSCSVKLTHDWDGKNVLGTERLMHL